jgi:sugar lactone lactonase YvrE
MRSKARIVQTVGAIAAASIFAACSVGTQAMLSTSPTQSRNAPAERVQAVNHKPNWISSTVRSEAGTNGLLFVADNFNNQVDIFSQAQPKKLIGTVTNGIASPTRLGVDAAGDLYVANFSENAVQMYVPPYSAGPNATYKGGFYGPVAVAIGTDGWVYVSDYADGLLVEFAPHRTKPSHVISPPGRVNGLALDANDDLFVAYESYTGFSGVLKFAPHSTTGKDLGIRVGFAGDLTFDSSGNLLVTDEQVDSVNVYPPGATTPSQTITDGFLNPIAIAFNGRRNRLYVADWGALDVEGITYPGAKIVSTITGFGSPNGVALSPAPPK